LLDVDGQQNKGYGTKLHEELLLMQYTSPYSESNQQISIMMVLLLAATLTYCAIVAVACEGM